MRGKRIGVNLTALSVDTEHGIFGIDDGVDEMYTTVHVENVASVVGRADLLAVQRRAYIRRRATVWRRRAGRSAGRRPGRLGGRVVRSGTAV